jgi:tetraprenyl-beta-curcumene synthase
VRRDPAPLTPAQARALAAATGRELGWGLRLVRREVATWRRAATGIADPVLREHAIGSLGRKRTLVDGAAFYWTLPIRRDPGLLRLLVAFQVLADVLDEVSERAGGRPGGDLMGAFREAVDLDAPVGHHDPYLMALIDACRAGCAALPAYALIRPALPRLARQCAALELHHITEPGPRAAALRRFAEAEFDHDEHATWFEQTAGGASALSIIVLLALAADPRTSERDIDAALAIYGGWVAALSMMLDSYVDQHDDARTGHVSFVGYYGDRDEALARVAELLEGSLRGAARLRGGERHVLVIAAMTAMFLSRDSARHPDLALGTRALTAAGGQTTRVLLPALRAWRAVYGQRGG